MKRPRILFASAAYSAYTSRNAIMLQKSGIEVSIFTPSQHLRWFPIPGLKLHEAGTDPSHEQWADALKRHLDTHEPYDLVLPNDDEALIALKKRVDEPWARALFPLDPDKVDVNLLASKVQFALHCSRWGMPMPRWKILASLADLEDAIEEIGCPLILKRDESTAGIGHAVVNSAKDAASCWTSTFDGQPLLAQEFIEGTTGSVGALYSHGQLVAWVSSYKSRTTSAFGPACERTLVSHPNTKDYLERFGLETGFHGMLGFDWIEDKRNGEAYLIELNARPTISFSVGGFAGINFGEAVRQVAEGSAVRQPDPNWGKRSPIIPIFPTCVERAVLSRKPAELARVFGSVNFWRDISLGQPRVLGTQCSYLGRQLMKVGGSHVSKMMRKLPQMRLART